MSKAITVLVAGGVERPGGIDLLEGVLWGFLKNPKGTRFEVPTGDPSGLLGALGDRFPLWPLGLGARGPLGAPTLRSIGRTDLVLLTGDVGGDVRPSLLLAASVARLRSRPLAAYGLRVPSAAARRAPVRWLLGRCDEVVARDGVSEVEARRAGARHVDGRAEPAFHLRGASAKTVEGRFPHPSGARLGLERAALLRRGLGIEAAVRAVTAATGVEPILLEAGSTAPEAAAADRFVLRRDDHRAETWTGILGALDLFVGERPAWVVRSLAMGVPVVVLGDGGEASGVLEDIGLASARTEAASVESFAEAVSRAWSTREEETRRTRAAVALGRAVAREAAARISARHLRGA